MNTSIANYMCRDLIVIQENDKFVDFKDYFDRRGIHHLLVLDGHSNLKGIVSQEDLKWFKSKLLDEKLTANIIMTENPMTVYENDHVSKAINIFLENRFRALPVLDVNDELVGIFTPYDVMKKHIEMIA